MWVPSPFRSAGLARGFNTVQQGPRQLQNVLARLQARIEEQRMMSLLEVGGGGPSVSRHGWLGMGKRRLGCGVQQTHSMHVLQCVDSQKLRGGALTLWVPAGQGQRWFCWPDREGPRGRIQRWACGCQAGNCHR